MNEVAIPAEEDKHLLHQVREDIVQLLGGEGREVVLATVQDAAALAAPAHDEVVRDVGSSVLNEPVLSSAPSSVANLALYSRDAQLLWMQVISGDQNVGMLAQTSASPRHGEIGGKFCKLFNCKQFPLFTVPCVSSIVQKSLVPSPVSCRMLVTLTSPRSSSLDSAVYGSFTMFKKPLCWVLGMGKNVPFLNIL